MKYSIIYFLIISIISVIVCCYDKRQARRGKHRISENNLLYICILGGGIAMYLTMRIIHHKTRHNKFMIGIPAIIVLQTVAIFLVYMNISGNLKIF